MDGIPDRLPAPRCVRPSCGTAMPLRAVPVADTSPFPGRSTKPQRRQPNPTNDRPNIIRGSVLCVWIRFPLNISLNVISRVAIGFCACHRVPSYGRVKAADYVPHAAIPRLRLGQLRRRGALAPLCVPCGEVGRWCSISLTARIAHCVLMLGCHARQELALRKTPSTHAGHAYASTFLLVRNRMFMREGVAAQDTHRPTPCHPRALNSGIADVVTKRLNARTLAFSEPV